MNVEAGTAIAFLENGPVRHPPNWQRPTAEQERFESIFGAEGPRRMCEKLAIRSFSLCERVVPWNSSAVVLVRSGLRLF